MKPFSNNIIFFDTEFSGLDPNKAELISIALVKTNGEELYLELDYRGECSDWVKKNVLPFLKGNKVSKKEAVKMVKQFVGEGKPHIVGYINQDDVVYWQKMQRSVGINKDIFNVVSIDFATVLFMLGADPEVYYSGNKNGFFEKIGIDYKKFKIHNALDDAKLLRETYLSFIENPAVFVKKLS